MKTLEVLRFSNYDKFKLLKNGQFTPFSISNFLLHRCIALQLLTIDSAINNYVAMISHILVFSIIQTLCYNRSEAQ